MGLNVSDSQYVNSEHSQFISVNELRRVLGGQRSNDIYQSQISYNNHNQQNSQYNSNYYPQQQYPHNPSQQRDIRYIRKVLSFAESSQSVTDYLKTLQQMGRVVECENLYLPIMCNVQGEQATCNDYRRLQMYFQNYDVRIIDQIAARKRERQIFAEEDVWYILYSIINACRKFESVNLSSGNLKTQNVLLNAKGHIKVVNRLSWPQQQMHLPLAPEKSPFHGFSKNGSSINCMSGTQTQSYPRQFILNSSHQNNNIHNTSFRSNSGKSSCPNFYAPEELRVMKQHIQKAVNPNIAQTYTIGIILLQVCTFISGEQFYQMRQLRVNEVVVRRAEEIMINRYSRLLNNLVRTMLSNAYDRPLPSQIYYAFKPYEKQILSLKPFKFDPNILHKALPMSQASY